MVIRAIYPPQKQNPYDYLEPREVQTYSILELLVPVTLISEKRTELPYHESYKFWRNPENTVTHQDIVQLRHHLYGEEFEFPIASEEVFDFSDMPYDEESQDTGFSIPSVWGKGNKR